MHVTAIRLNWYGLASSHHVSHGLRGFEVELSQRPQQTGDVADISQEIRP
jgi:hypothetical protein